MRTCPSLSHQHRSQVLESGVLVHPRTGRSAPQNGAIRAGYVDQRHASRLGGNTLNQGNGGCMTIQAPAMRQRFAAQAVIEELLRQHESTPPRNTFSRFFGYSPLSTDSVSWYRGAQGEIIVGGILATLPLEWTSFHALPIGKKDADIDHIVVGPGGVFTINTKHHNNKGIWVAGRTLMVSGRKHPHIPSAETEAKRVTTLLSEGMPLARPVIKPVVVLVAPRSLSIKKKPKQVQVITASALRRWLLKHPVILDETGLAQVAAILDDPATWPSRPDPIADSRARFDALDSEIRSAYIRRTLWRVFGTLALSAALLLAGPPLISALLSAYIEAMVQP
jgi:hypothetical protein